MMKDNWRQILSWDLKNGDPYITHLKELFKDLDDAVELEYSVNTVMKWITDENIIGLPFDVILNWVEQNMVDDPDFDWIENEEMLKNIVTIAIRELNKY